MTKSPDGASDLKQALRGMRPALIAAFVFAGLLNVLALTGALYMMQVYDRVIPSRSVASLIALSVLALILFCSQGVLDVLRGRILLRLARAFDERLGSRLFRLIARAPVARDGTPVGVQPLRDLDGIRSFMSGGGPSALMDLPWMPLYLVICAMIHPLIGLMVAGGALILVGLAFATDSITRAPIRLVSETGAARMTIAEATRRNAEVVTAMGMGAGVSAAFDRANRAHLDANDRAADTSSTLGTFAKIFRMALQSAVLGVGAYLVINQQATGGVILASSILSARALAPIDQAIAHWRGFVGARQSWARLSTLLANAPGSAEILPLEAPTTRLTVEGMSIAVPGLDRVVVRDVSFGIDGGTALGIIGPSASGKSSLARALVGIWRPARGSVRLDGASLDQWSPDALGRHVGYLPQSIELFDGTVAQNIARFYPDADPRAVLKAAEGAGVHDMIVRLPQGYETRLGEGGAALSGGQRQRIGLARALYGDPFLLVLDEPNSNLDGEGEQALNAAVQAVKARGGIAVVIAHRAGALAAVDTVMLMADGAARAIGPKDEVLRTLMRPVEPSRPRLHVQAGAA